MLNCSIAYNCASFPNTATSHHRSATYSPAAALALQGSDLTDRRSGRLERSTLGYLAKQPLFTIVDAPMARFITLLSKRSNDTV